MAQSKLTAGAILCLAAAIVLHAAATLYAPATGTPWHPQQVAAQSVAAEPSPPIYYVARDTYFITTSQNGRAAYLWYYDFNPDRGRNTVQYVTSATTGQ